MKKLISLFVSLFTLTANLLAFAATSNPGFVQYTTIPAVATTVSFKTYARVVQIWSDPAAADLYVNYKGGTAAVGDINCIHLPGGSGWQSPPQNNLGCNSISVIGASATGSYTVTAQ